MKIQSTPITFIDQTDSRKLEVYIKSNLPTVQIYNSNTGAYTPDWREGEKLTLTTDVFLDSRVMTTEEYASTLIKWYKDKISTGTEIQSNRNLKTLQLTTNELATNPIITYICEATYQDIVASMRLTFTRVDTGLNGKAGADGTSIKILGTADSVSLVPDTNYYTIVYSQGSIIAAELGDAYVYQGNLYVCSVLDGEGTNDYFVNVGPIQGQKGEDAKSIVLSGNSQTFKISKSNVITPSVITVVAQTSNTSVTNWSYSTNGGQTFLSTTPNGVSRSGNIVTITGSTLTSDSVTIKASDGTYSDSLTVYKAFDGIDGVPGASGDPAPIAFLTNENITFAANAKGQVTGAAFTTNVVAYSGTSKVTPAIGTITGLPTGMTYNDSTTVGNELILSFAIANNATLGSDGNSSGSITIPVTSPVVTNLRLNWSKVNSGAEGNGISSIAVSYGTSNSASIQPTDWQSTIPTVNEDSYLWTRTIIDYTNPSVDDTVTYTYAKQGAKGEPGVPGTAVTVSSVEYQSGDSSTAPPTGTWSNSVVAVPDGQYLWTKTTFSDNTVSYCVAKQGVNGTDYYVHIRYRANEDDTTLTTTPNDYMGVYSGTSSTAPTSVSSYTWYNVKGSSGERGEDSIVFQVYSSNGYVLSKKLQAITLETFAHKGSSLISGGATYQWYESINDGWQAITDATNSYLDVLHTDVMNNKSYKCTMTFEGMEYSDVVTVEDKTDINTVYTSKPTSYSIGDLWVVGVDYIPSGYTDGIILRAEQTRDEYRDADWVPATKYDERLDDLEGSVDNYNQYFSFDKATGITMTAVDTNGKKSPFSTVLSNSKLSFNQGSQEVAYISNNKLNITEAEVVSPLSVTGKYSGNTILQAPTLNIGNFSIIVESNGSLSIIANT